MAKVKRKVEQIKQQSEEKTYRSLLRKEYILKARLNNPKNDTVAIQFDLIEIGRTLRGMEPVATRLAEREKQEGNRQIAEPST